MQSLRSMLQIKEFSLWLVYTLLLIVLVMNPDDNGVRHFPFAVGL
jgi:hypothetical protein